jgi:cell division protein FtsW
VSERRFMTKASDDTFQVGAAMAAPFSGGWFGPRESIAKLLPDSHTDFVFSVVADEFGIILSLVLLLLLAFVVIRAPSRGARGHRD